MIPRGNPLLKGADRWGGIPLVLALRRWRRRPPPQRPGAVGLLKTNAIGDTVLVSGIVQDLRNALPRARLVLLVGPNNRDVARLIPGADDVVELPIHRPDRASRLLREQRLDALLDLGSWPRINAVLARLSGARYTAGFRTAGQHRHHVYDGVIDHSPTLHEIDNYRRLVGLLGVATGARPRLATNGAGSHDEAPYAILHAWPGGTRRDLKQWPTPRWVELAGLLVRRGLRVELTGGPGDVEPARALARACGDGATSLAGELSIAELANRLSRASLVVSVDTGVMHMASALDVPLVALHGPTAPSRWGPLSPRGVAVASPEPGSGYLNLGFDYPDDPPASMEAISVEAVVEAVVQVLDR